MDKPKDEQGTNILTLNYQTNIEQYWPQIFL